MIQAMQVSPDGNWLARAGIAGKNFQRGEATIFQMMAGQVELWAIPAAGKTAPTAPTRTFQTGNLSVFGLAFRGDGKVLAAGSLSGHLFLWDLTSGKVLHDRPLRGPDGLEGLAFNPDGRLLAGISRTAVVVWDAVEGQQVASFTGAEPRSGDTGISPRVAWSPDGRWLAGTNWDHSVSIWDGADRTNPAIREEMRQSARARLPLWHLENAERALNSGRREAAEDHLRRMDRPGPLEPGWALLRGQLLANRGEWDRASADYSRGLTGDPPVSAGVWREHLTLLARAGKADECKRVAEMLVDRFAADADAGSGTHAALACAMLPGMVRQPDRVVQMARKTLNTPARKRSAWHLHALAIAQVRARQYADAERTANQAMNGDSGWDRQHVMTWMTLALAHHHQGRAEEARRWWDKAKARLDVEEQTLKESGKSVPANMGWVDWLWMRQLRAETARTLGE
jgi:tetratricopeptide (TPR) repeat protein